MAVDDRSGATTRLRPAAQAARATASRCLGRRARCCRDGSRRAFSLVSPGPSHWDRKARRAGVGGGPITFLRSAYCAARLPPCPGQRGWPDPGRRAAAVVEVRPPRLPPWHDWQSGAAGQPAPGPSRCGGAGVKFGCVPAAQVSFRAGNRPGRLSRNPLLTAALSMQRFSCTCV